MGFKYTVKQGDTGNAISQKFSISFAGGSGLEAANPGVVWTNLQINQQLNVPGFTYRVDSGETGYEIANRFVNFPFDPALNQANPNVNWNGLQIGQRLQVPGPRLYRVVSGDTGNNLAAKFGMQFAQLSQANPNVNWNNLAIGQQLNVPSC